MTLKPYPERYEPDIYSEKRTEIPVTIIKPTLTTRVIPSQHRPSYSGVGSGGPGGGSSSYTPTQKIPEVKEEPKPKQIPITKLPSTQKERRERDLISRQLRIKGRVQKNLKKQIIYRPKSEIEYDKKTIQEIFKEKKKQRIERKTIKEKEQKIKKRDKDNQKELNKRMKAYQLYLEQQFKQRKTLPIKEIKYKEVLDKSRKIKWL